MSGQMNGGTQMTGTEPNKTLCRQKPNTDSSCLLPTLQRNALCKLFDRREFSPDDVARLGYHRLQQAEGIGVKGLATIEAWLGAHGLELTHTDHPRLNEASRKKTGRRVELALQLLRQHGYVISEVGEEDAPTGHAVDGA